MMRAFFILLLLVILIAGCAPQDERAIRDSDVEFMIELEGALVESDIPFTVDREGYIRYPVEYQEKVERIVSEVDKLRSREVGIKFEDEESNRYFRKLLEEKGIQYRVEVRNGEEWVFWRPSSVEERERIEMQVIIQNLSQQKSRDELRK